ncbi:hypothetical protein [Fictibacillus barbaricus]|uniref:Uncharacterized protein n=1 Tax=Fictibacillus barbaricus TaxID=182136 RepID=A0ABS2ZCD2_9BACL|nr:hypothetical protein [Fictibacillus barbaricus]MBN3544324.1 hypothetical protein [Fictibacillus barbaricus]GGB67773.1 hypothetical protein GCM10007199_37390 [Fictibacillus barbaricus]
MIKRGKYTSYNNKEYSIGKEGDDWVNLVSKDSKDLNNGFQPHPLDKAVFVKKVSRNKLDKIYKITPYAIYKGYKLSIGGETDGKILLGTGEVKIADALGFNRTDKYFYEKWIDNKDLKIMEEKEILN